MVGMRWKPSRVLVGGAVLDGSRAADIDAKCDEFDIVRCLLLMKWLLCLIR